MPTASDLVTDLPADFEVFGQAVDTSLADLKGGTTDQVLAKNSNTDMDFKWVTSDDANAIQNSIVDAKGDLIAASANDTPARLAVGANGETLVADSSTSTGLRYQGSMAAGKNAIVNGGYDVWQRGTSFTAGSAYTADRWFGGTATARTISRQLTGDTTNLPFIQYCARIQRNSGATSTINCDLGSPVETVNTIPYAGKAITLSYYARAGANFSSTSSLMRTALFTGTGTDQNAFIGYTGNATPIDTNVTLTTTWQRFQHTITLGSTVTEMMPYFGYTPVGTAGANDYFEVTGVQVEVGSIATQFSRAGGTLQGELAACQRYYYRASSTGGYKVLGNGFAGSVNDLRIFTQLPVTMRIIPSLTETSAMSTFYYENPSSSGTTPAGITLSSVSSEDVGVVSANKTAAFISGASYTLMSNNVAAFLGFGAEL